MINEVLEYAKSCVGKQEIPGNQGFKDPVFDLAMRRVGFKNGWAWCALFAELCYSVPEYEGKSKVIATISDCFSANAVRTFENFLWDENIYFEASQNIKEGSVVIWQKNRGGKPVQTSDGLWTLGHAGIVEQVHRDYFVAIEGNTNSSGGREGIEVARKERKYNFDIDNGLEIVGFITPLI